MTRPRLLRSVSLFSVLALAACQEASEDTEPVASDDLRAGHRTLTLGEFEARFNAGTGAFEIEMLPVEAWQTPPEAPSDTMRTVPQALWCDVEVGVGTEKVLLDTVAGSIGETVQECGLPVNGITAAAGAFCATTQLTSNIDGLLSRPMAEIIETTSGYQGYTFIETGGLIGVDPSTLGGPNPPSDAFGLFGYESLTQGGTSRTQWVFHNARTGDFAFRGKIVAEAFEACNGVDDDCDGFVDEGAGCNAQGEACVDHVDCDTGYCTAGGVCGPSSCSDSTRNGSETDIDCGGTCPSCPDGAACVDDGDCSSGYCQASLCVANPLPEAGDLVITEVMVDPGVDQDREWFEVFNPTTTTFELSGCHVGDGSGTYPLAPQQIGPGYHVFAHSAGGSNPDPAGHASHVATLGGSVIFYDSVTFNNGSDDEVRIVCGGELVDAFAYDFEQIVDSMSRSLEPDSIDWVKNNNLEAWCNGQDVYDGAFLGSPGEANPTCNVTIDACEMLAPLDLSIPVGSTAAYQALVRVDGVTTASTGSDPKAGRMIGQLGFGYSITDPDAQWLFFEASPDMAWTDTTNPGYDRYEAQFVVPGEAGDLIHTAYRWSGDNGATWTTCDNRGTINVEAPVLTPTAPGDIVISEIMPNPEGVDSTGEWFEITNPSANPMDVAGCQFCDNAGCDTVSGSLVIQPNTAAVFALDVDASNAPPGAVFEYSTLAFSNGGGGDELSFRCGPSGSRVLIDEITYEGSAPSGLAYQLDPAWMDHAGNDDTGMWCFPHSDNEYDASLGNYGTPGAVNPPCYEISLCRTQAPTDLDLVSPSVDYEVFGRVQISELTEGSASNDEVDLVQAWVGFGPDGSLPEDGGWTWIAAEGNDFYSSHAGTAQHEIENDEYVATLTVPAAGGPWDVAYRFSPNAGVDYVYCDLDKTGDGGGDGSDDGYAPADSVPMSLIPPIVISDCLVEPVAGGGFVVDGRAGTTETLYAALTIPGVTDGAGNQSDPRVLGQWAYGPIGTAPATWEGAGSTWEDAEHDPGFSGTTSDRWRYDATVPTAKDAPYAWAFRFSGNGGVDWTYCDSNGQPYATADAGSVSPQTDTIDDCFLGTDALSGFAGATVDADAFIWASPLTETTEDAADPADDLLYEFGYAEVGDPVGSYTWTRWESGVSGHTIDGVFEYDYYLLPLTVPDTPGQTYDTLVRVSADGGGSWTVCDENGIGSATPGSLTVQSIGVPYSEDFDGQVGKGVSGIGTDLTDVTWTLDLFGATFDNSADYCQVVDQGGDRFFEVQDSNGQCIWVSPSIDISTVAAVDMSLELDDDGGSLESGDTTAVHISIDGGPLQFVDATNNDFGVRTVNANNLVGSTLRIYVTMENNTGGDRINLDDISVVEHTEPVGGGGDCIRLTGYVEGSSNNKGVEIWNCGTGDIDLTRYTLRQYNCGSSSCNNIYNYSMTGTLAANEVRTYCNNSWGLAASCDVRSNHQVFTFNGNDALAIIDEDDGGVIVDAIGRPHGSSSNFASNDSLQRTDCTAYNGAGAWSRTDYFTVYTTSNDTTGWGVAPTCTDGP